MKFEKIKDIREKNLNLTLEMTLIHPDSKEDSTSTFAFL